jgi:two-component system phosphate regulon sensor histidine kinase PhoR
MIPPPAKGFMYFRQSMNKRRTSIVLMALTIGVIAAFQAYWLRKNYEEEKKTFLIRTNLLFNQSVSKLQASRLHLDSSQDGNVRFKTSFITVTNLLKKAVLQDSVHPKNTTLTLSYRLKPDSLDTTSAASGKFKIFDFLTGIDSLQGLITAHDITVNYQKDLQKEGIRLPFRITKLAVAPPGAKSGHRPATGIFFRDSGIDLRQPIVTGDAIRQQKRMLGDPSPEIFILPDSNANRVTVGFSHPVVYQLDFDNVFWYLSRRIGPQALFSLLLIGLTTLSFIWLYRNWLQQKRLIALKNDFIGNMTHELKTPIATVSVAVEALQHFNALQDPVRTKEYLDISAGELQRLSLLVDKVLKLSLFEKQEIELKNETFDLKALAEEVIASMRLQFEKCQARLRIDAEGTDFFLRADKLHITSVLYNLLDNALKYTHLQPSIQVDLVAETDQLALSVTDNGVGIAAAYREKIFEKFFRVPTGDRHNVKGYGLGLSYVSYVLQRQGGHISVESELGAGSRFTVKIPRNHNE